MLVQGESLLDKIVKKKKWGTVVSFGSIKAGHTLCGFSPTWHDIWATQLMLELGWISFHYPCSSTRGSEVRLLLPTSQWTVGWLSDMSEILAGSLIVEKEPPADSPMPSAFLLWLPGDKQCVWEHHGTTTLIADGVIRLRATRQQGTSVKLTLAMKLTAVKVASLPPVFSAK